MQGFFKDIFYKLKTGYLPVILGFLSGLINGTVGAGGGLITVPSLIKTGTHEKRAHSTAVAILLPVSLVSAVIYLIRGNVTFGDAFPYMIPSVVGAVLGTIVLDKIPKKALSVIFSLFMIYAGVRLILR